MMTQRHFEAIQQRIARTRASFPEAVPALDSLTEDLADFFAEDNPHFNREMFLKGCDFPWVA